MRHARIITALLVGVVAVAPQSAAAQSALPTPGTRVRVSAPDFDIKADAGKLLRATSDSLTVDFAGERGELTIPIDRVSRLEVSTGKRRAAGFGYGAGLGTVVGVLAGIGVGALMQLDCKVDEFCGLWFIVTVPGGAGLGFIVGGVTGLARAPDRWQEVSLSRQPSGLGMLWPAPAQRVGISIAF
jgi:hypothetical protein